MLIKVTIKNFLSIKEEQTIKINKNVTSIIGKNESGKSTLLKAINKLNGNNIKRTEKNVNMKDEESYIAGYFYITKEELKRINKEYCENVNYAFYKLPEEYNGLYFMEKVNDTDNVYYGLYYMGDDKKLKLIETSIFADRIRKEVKKILKDEQSDEINTFIKEIDKLSDYQIKNQLQRIKVSENNSENITNLCNEIEKSYWIKLLPKYKLISFNSFSDVLKDNVLYSELEKNQQAKNILSIAKIDIGKLGEAFDENNEQELEDMQTKYIDIVSKKFKEIFQQTDENFKLKTRFGTSKKEIIFLTQDKTSGNNSINLSQRSDGFKWYLSLYLTLYDYLNKVDTETNYILLLDEPNLYLHPGAQNNLLYNVFNKEFSDVQIIYTTHSPYMINTDNSFSIRIIEKDEQTNVYNSPREYAEKKSNVKDVDTLSPLLTALGLHISNSITLNDKDIVIAVEGIQDVYILKAMIRKIKQEKKYSNIKFISGMSAEKVPFMFSYLSGMGYNTFCLVDNDKAGRKVVETITNLDNTDELTNRVIKYDIAVPSKKDFLLESLFSENDRKKYLEPKSTILYKNVYDNIDSIEFDTETITNFKNMLDELYKHISS